jgi:hypothetical protein
MQYAMVGDGGGSRRMLDPTEGFDDSGAWQASGCNASDDDTESTASACWMIAGGGDAESTIDVVILTAGRSLLMSASSTWKFSVPIVRLIPTDAGRS